MRSNVDTNESDPIVGLRIARSDVAFIHDVLMSCQFSGAQMLQAAGIVAGLRPALAAQKPVEVGAISDADAVEAPTLEHKRTTKRKTKE